MKTAFNKKTRKLAMMSDTNLLLTITIVVFVLMYLSAMLFIGRGFLRFQMFFNILNENAALIILSCGMSIVMITGGIDISVGKLTALICMSAAVNLDYQGGNVMTAVLLSLAIGIALNPKILLLDEPTANLDIATRKEIMRTLNDLKEITETVIIATHDMQLVCEWADRIIVLSGGKVIADGSRNEIFGNENVVSTSGIRPPEIFEMGQTLDKNSLCYTIDEFLESFEGRRIEDEDIEKIIGKCAG